MPKDTDALPTTRTSSRDQSLDVAKGIGIILVVLGHCLDGLVAAGYFPPALGWPILAIALIYLFHMPLFFAVSGHLASGKHRPAGVTFAKLFPTIVYPYFLWSILLGLVQVYLSKYTTSHFPISSLYRILWIPIVPFWFLYALFFCHVGYLAIRRYSHRVQLVIAIAAFGIPLFFMPAIAHVQMQIVHQVVRGFLFFVLGVVTVAQVKQFGRWTAISSSALYLLFATIAIQSQLGGAVGTVAVLPAAITGIVATLAWSRMLASQQGRFAAACTRLLAFLGRYSMSIYVMHIFFTAGVRIALKRLAAHPTPLVTGIEITSATVVGIAMPLAINWVVSKFDLDRWFGIQHMETT